MKSDVEDGYYACEEIVNNEEKLDDRMNVLEEEVKTIKAENNELRTFVNTIVKELNNVITLLNTRYDVKY